MVCAFSNSNLIEKLETINYPIEDRSVRFS